MFPRDALLLDFGGVIVRSIFECLGDVERHFGLPSESLAWRGPLDPARDELWREVLEEKIGEREYWRLRLASLSEQVGRALDMGDIIAAMCGPDPNRAVRPEAVLAISKARARGCRVGVLSNELERLYGQEVIGRLDILRQMDCVIDGSWSRIHKPLPEAYAYGLAALRAAAERTVFVDDQPRNVEAAVSAGMAGVLFDIADPASSFRAAERLLGIE